MTGNQILNKVLEPLKVVGDVTYSVKSQASDVRANAINLVCPFCSVMYDSNQKGIETAFNATYNLPVLYLTQLLGLAMGMDRKELGLNMNVVKTKDALAKYAGGD